MLSVDKITEIFFISDEFCKEFHKNITKAQIDGKGAPKRRKRKFKMSDAEVITLLIMFHASHFRNLKHFYINYIQKHMTKEFPETVSYNRFTELQQKVMLPMVIMLKTIRLGESTGIAFIDSTPIRVCKQKRIRNNKVFKDIAKIGKSTMGWFFGFKLHLVVNDKGEILNFLITPGNIDDRQPLKDERFIKNLSGKLFGDKGYISKELFEMLFINGIQLITNMKRNMKNQLMSLSDKILLRKRSVIETINDQLKNICHVEHSRHRSVKNFLSNLISGLLTYSFFDKKPAIKYQTKETFGQLALY